MSEKKNANGANGANGMNGTSGIPESDRESDRLNVAPGVKPFTKYKGIELAVCGFAVILGLLYLYAGFLRLGVLLPIYCAFFAAITVLRYLDTKAIGGRGFAAMLPVVCWGILTAAVIVATGAYFMQ